MQISIVIITIIIITILLSPLLAFKYTRADKIIYLLATTPSQAPNSQWQCKSYLDLGRDAPRSILRLSLCITRCNAVLFCLIKYL